MKREFNVLIERDEDGYYVATVPELRSCYTQGRSLDELMVNVREVIELCLEVAGEAEPEPPMEFIGIQRMSV